ncbi:MAG: glutamate synthase large subunit [Candidatus Latescibacterota bacterium]|nr:glutamate synthase large subunit [Candidatus Latescibacterota bacterium]
MKYPAAYPQPQGLYHPKHEHDACGIGFVAHIKGQRSHDIVQQALEVLDNLDHRGARGAEETTGDGAGILMQVPHEFLAAVMVEQGVQLPAPGEYGVGMLFLPRAREVDRHFCESAFESIAREEGFTVLGWRDVPTDNSSVGNWARGHEPFHRQVFLQRPDGIGDDPLAFERKLYILGKRASHEIRHSEEEEGDAFYVSSLSHRTIVYKGMLTPQQVPEYFEDLCDARVESAICLVHSRFSTNTFPSWERAHPYRYLIHNGEINTLRGNENWMHTRQAMLDSELFGDNLDKLFPIVEEDGSDSAKLDNAVEFLHLGGRSLAHAVMMAIPEPWEKHEAMSDEKKAFYEFHSCLMEPWDGPASIAFTDGTVVGAILDRNGLRPSRYYVTKDDRVIMGSEVGVLSVEPELVAHKGRLQPGRIFLVDTAEGRIIDDEELKHAMATEHPYREWLDANLIDFEDLPDVELPQATRDHDEILERQQTFGFNFEDIRITLTPMAKNAFWPLGSMGNDAALAVLSDRPRLLYDYFKQLFAQVTNPPIDPIREELVTATETTLGSEGNLLNPQPESCRQLRLTLPILTDGELAKLKGVDRPGLKAQVLPMLYSVCEGEAGLRKALDELFAAAETAIENGATILILSDRDFDADRAPIPALLASAGLHHHLIRAGKRGKTGLVIESGEPREVHHYCLLLGYGANAINPYMVYESLADMIAEKVLPEDLGHGKAVDNYNKGVIKGIVKVMSKMGISTFKSYRGAQIFEAVGIKQEVVDEFFTWTDTRVEGIGLDVIARETQLRHKQAYPPYASNGKALDVGGEYQWRDEGEHHLFNPLTIHKLQKAVRTDDWETYQQYADLIDDQTAKMATLRGLLELDYPEGGQIPIEEVEPVEAITKRFKSGAMSYGSISKEAHETLAIAMNRIGGKSNTGEGGEDPARYVLDPNGDSRNSAIKQVASGRFGVTSNYLVHAKELQIKMAQGAKPGEGGELPGGKVYPWIAQVRQSTPGVGLISPPPHHDIYSIEDLAELIHDLKNSNRDARINVKLVSEVGVGTVAAGVAKGHADVVLISGHDGGTGASPQTSIKHAGLPWELGLADTHQTLVLNHLRDRIVVETDGQLKTGRDVVIAALLGAEEFGFATTALVAMGCIMMRVCHLDTCPVGVATQNPMLREKFTGGPEHVVSFLKFIAEDMRRHMAKLGCRTVEEMVGHTYRLKQRATDHWKAKGVDLSKLLHQPDVGPEVGRYCCVAQEHGIEKSIDLTKLLDICAPAIERGEKVEASLPIQNTDRVVGTVTGGELTKRYGPDGLPNDTIHLKFTGSAGQSFGAFVPPGMTLELAGDANDYFGKGLSGGKLILYPPEGSTFVPKEEIIVGNVSFYGATSGEAYIRGMAGERFCVRNSGVRAVVEAVGDHGLEYMTGGRAVVLGPVGRNFAAGMSGGIAYVHDEAGNFADHCNQEMCELEPVENNDDIAELREMIENHKRYTNSDVAEGILSDWNVQLPKFVKVMPKDYKRVLEALARARESGLSGDEAVMEAFEANRSDTARVSGN